MAVAALSLSPIEYSRIGWRDKLFGGLNEQLDQIIKESKMESLSDITNAIFQNKSEILGGFVHALIEKQFSHLLDQGYHRCASCDRKLKARKEKVKRTIQTLAGTFDLYRPYFYCKHCHKGYYPLDEALGLSSSAKQHDIQDLEAWLASELPFETVAEAFKRCTGEALSADHMHETANEIASHFGIIDVCPTKEEIDQQIKKLSDGKFWRPVMMLAIDGAHAPTRPEPSPWKGTRGKGEWKEVKGFRLYLLDTERIIHLVSWHQVQTDQELAEDLATIKNAGLIPENEVRLCIIGDGAPWIWNRVRELFPKAKEVLDYYHCSEHIHKVANIQYGKGTRKARQWVEATLTRLFNKRVDDVIKGLKRMDPSTALADKAIQDLIGYLTKHKDRVDYRGAKRGGYHIGSGAIESANKFIGHVRLKRSGAWCYITNANNILKLRCAKYNGTYDRMINQYMEINRGQSSVKKSYLHLRLIE
jgi:hypothetical protein